MRGLPPLIPLLCMAVLLAGGASEAGASPAGSSGDEDRMERIEEHLRAVQDELAALKRERDVDAARVAEVEQEVVGLQTLAERVKIGGYGSMRWEGNSLGDEENTFTFRRFVLTTDAQLAPRLRLYTELEYERFRKLELERRVTRVASADGGPGLSVEQAVEGTDGSEIAFEQAWLEWEFDPRLRVRTGGVLVPLGRFNLNHDDNQWNLPRRSLVDRGVPVLPSTSAWNELGLGVVGSFELGEGSLGYQLFVVNGVVLEAELEELLVTRAGRRDKLELEAEFSPQTGTFSKDTKGAKALTGRLAWQPEAGHELALSFYTGRYTPDYLADRAVTALALDGITRFAGFELEGQLATTHWGGLGAVARSFAANALERSSFNSALDDPVLESEIELELEGLAKRLTGYWLELRYPFWPEGLTLGAFPEAALVPTARFEQVWFNDRLVGADFSNGQLTELEREDRRLSRATLGLAFRPTPLVVISAAYEYIWTDAGESLNGLTNFLSARDDESSGHALMMGASFGF